MSRPKRGGKKPTWKPAKGDKGCAGRESVEQLVGEKEALDDLLNITGRNGVLCDRPDECLKMSLAMLVDEIGQRWCSLGLCISLGLLQLQEVEVKQDTPSGHPKPFGGGFVAL